MFEQLQALSYQSLQRALQAIDNAADIILSTASSGTHSSGLISGANAIDMAQGFITHAQNPSVLEKIRKFEEVSPELFARFLERSKTGPGHSALSLPSLLDESPAEPIAGPSSLSSGAPAFGQHRVKEAIKRSSDKPKKKQRGAKRKSGFPSLWFSACLINLSILPFLFRPFF
jgi:hypothetical protein